MSSLLLTGLTAFAVLIGIVAGAPSRPVGTSSAAWADTPAGPLVGTAGSRAIGHLGPRPAGRDNSPARRAVAAGARNKAVRVAAAKATGTAKATGRAKAKPKPAVEARTAAAAQRRPTKRVLRGNDVSWPQCGKHGLRMPKTSRHFVVIGLTGGRAFRRNPCVVKQVAWAKKHHFYAGAYAMTTYPTKAQLRAHGHKGPFSGKTRASRLRNAGAAAARFDVRTLKHAKLGTRHIWIDVEPHPSRRWTHNKKANKAVLDGLVRGYRDAGLSVGFYSTKALWHNIAGNAKYHAPEWRTAGPTSVKKAGRMCKRGSFQGGSAVLAQWWTRTVDHNRTCGTTGDSRIMHRYFVKY
jgi:hypothetical protein